MMRLPFRMRAPYLLSRGTQALDNACVLIETSVGLLKQAVDDINNPPPIGVYGFDVGQLGTYSVRARSSILEKPLREMKEARILGVELRASVWVQRSLKGDVCGAYKRGRLGGLLQGGRDFCLERLERIHGEFIVRSSSEVVFDDAVYGGVSLGCRR